MPLFPPSGVYRLTLAVALWALAFGAQAFSVSISPGTQAIYLRVGTGSAVGNYQTGGTMQNNTTVDTVRATLSAAALVAGTPVAMVSSSSQGNSFYDGFSFCTAPAQVYIGGFLRRPQGTSTAALVANVPASLSNGTGQTIAFSSIRWTSSGNGESGVQPIPAGTFAPGAQSLASFRANTWQESCHAFTYANASVVAAGTYTGRVVYTLTAP